MDYRGEERRQENIRHQMLIVEVNNKLTSLISLYERDNDLRDKYHEDHEMRIRMLERIADNTKAVADHEVRLRDMEKDKWINRGINIAASSFVALFWTIISKFFFRL